MPRLPVPTQESVAEINAMMSAAFSRLGSRQADAEIELAMNAVPLDGTPFGVRPAELRRPQSVFYFQPYLEARCVIRTLVEIGVHARVRDVRRLLPPAPDVVVEFDEGAAHIEHAMVVDQRAYEVLVAIEEANFRFHELATSDLDVHTLLQNGVLHVRLDYVSVEDGIDKDALASETTAFAKAIQGALPAQLVVDANRFPSLTASRAWIVYRPCNSKTWAPIRSAEPFLDRHSEFIPAFRKLLEQKHRKAASYDRGNAPLWLLLSIGNGFEAQANRDEAIQGLVSDIGLGPFDRLLVQRPRRHPLVFTAGATL